MRNNRGVPRAPLCERYENMTHTSTRALMTISVPVLLVDFGTKKCVNDLAKKREKKEERRGEEEKKNNELINGEGAKKHKKA